MFLRLFSCMLFLYNWWFMFIFWRTENLWPVKQNQSSSWHREVNHLRESSSQRIIFSITALWAEGTSTVSSCVWFFWVGSKYQQKEENLQTLEFLLVSVTVSKQHLSWAGYNAVLVLSLDWCSMALVPPEGKNTAFNVGLNVAYSVIHRNSIRH